MKRKAEGQSSDGNEKKSKAFNSMLFAGGSALSSPSLPVERESELKQTKLIPIFIPFEHEEKPISAAEQAEKIILEGEKRINEFKATGFCITYSANELQTRAAYEAYCNKEKIKIEGGNQAEVIGEIHQQIRGEFRILPISTCLAAGGRGDVKKENLVYCLANIACYLGANANGKERWVLLGWKNQVSGDRFAIGGGIKKLSDEHNALIQSTLRYFAEEADFDEKPEGPVAEIFPKLKDAFELGKKEGDPLAYARCYLNQTESPPSPLISQGITSATSQTTTLPPLSFGPPPDSDFPDLSW